MRVELRQYAGPVKSWRTRPSNLKPPKIHVSKLINDINRTSQEATNNGLWDKERYVIPPHLHDRQEADLPETQCKIVISEIAQFRTLRTPTYASEDDLIQLVVVPDVELRTHLYAITFFGLAFGELMDDGAFKGLKVVTLAGVPLKVHETDAGTSSLHHICL
ncbi:hypothetical protein EDB85DRAFT_2150503 [Lactarius pseudohatsudake]|nr:hypothetical protein EDB85DRAFT_2150503 [Lactarius pseudohatsudake]